MRALRVLHLDHTASAGGAEYALVRMLRADPSWRPLVLLPRGTGGGVFRSLRGIAPVHETGPAQPAGVSDGGLTRTAASTARLLAQSAAVRMHPAFCTADLVDANTARSAAYGALATMTRRVPLVIHLRDIITPEALGTAGHAMMTRIALPRAQAVVANSQATLDSARSHLRPDALTTVVPSASGLRPRSAASGHRSADRPLHIGMLARLDPWKGQAELLEAFIASFPDGTARLQLAGAALFGHEDYEQGLRARAVSAGVIGRVDFLGHVVDTDALLDGWDIAVHYATRPEPLGQNVLQYLASGTATIVADEGGPTEWVSDDDNGLRVAPRDVTALSAALSRLAAGPALRARLAAAAAATPGLLSDAEVTEQHARFYERVAARGVP